jgi:hypothetical protein
MVETVELGVREARGIRYPTAEHRLSDAADPGNEDASRFFHWGDHATSLT